MRKCAGCSCNWLFRFNDKELPKCAVHSAHSRLGQEITPSQLRSKKEIYSMPLEHEIAQGLRFDGFAGDYDSRTSECPVRTAVRNRLIEIVRSLRPHVIADVGCGTGTALIALAPSIEFGVGLDVSREMLKAAERNAPEAGAENLKFVFGSFHDLARDHQFWPTGIRPDVIMQCYALHHLSQDEKRVVIESMVKAVSPARGFVVLGDLMFFVDPAGLEAEFAAVGYNPQNDHPETADVMAKMLDDLGCVVQTYPVHRLAGIIVGELRQPDAEITDQT